MSKWGFVLQRDVKSYFPTEMDFERFLRNPKNYNLVIGITAETFHHGMVYLRDLYTELVQEHVCYLRDRGLTLYDYTDKTCYRFVSLNSYLGYSFDQLLIVDVSLEKREKLDILKQHVLSRSCVPKEFQVMEITYDR